MSQCTIVLPCYNEAARLDIRGLRSFARKYPSVRFLFVNDGSSDGTLAVLQRFCGTRPSDSTFSTCLGNAGKAEAVRQGILQAMAGGPDFVGYWDADLATPLRVIPEMCKLLERNPHLEIVLGSRVRLLGRRIRRRLLRHYLGRPFASAASLVLGLPVYDTQCGAKLFRVTPKVASLFAAPFRTGWIFDVELLRDSSPAARRPNGTRRCGPCTSSSCPSGGTLPGPKSKPSISLKRPSSFSRSRASTAAGAADGRKCGFQDEFRRLLRKYDIEYAER